MLSENSSYFVYSMRLTVTPKVARLRSCRGWRSERPCDFPAAEGVRQKEFGRKVTKKVTEASEKVTEKWPKASRKRKKVIELLLPHSFCGTLTCEFCNGMVASALAVTVVAAILQCELCAAKLSGILSCDVAAIQIRIRIVRCERPAELQKHKPRVLCFAPSTTIGR